MAQVFRGRYTARIDEPLVVFLIGMRINQLWAVHKWMPVAAAMPPIEVGSGRIPPRVCLAWKTGNWMRWREAMNVQHWRSFEDANLPRLGPAAAIGNRETARLRLGGYGGAGSAFTTHSGGRVIQRQCSPVNRWVTSVANPISGEETSF